MSEASRRHHGQPRQTWHPPGRRAPDALLEPALPRADPLPPRALAEHEARAVRRRPRPAGVQPRSRPRPARQINGGDVACQYLPPNVNGYSLYCPYNGPTSRRPAGSSPSPAQGAAGHDLAPRLPAGHRNAAYLVSVCKASVTRLGSSSFRTTGERLASRPPGGRRRQLLDRRLPVADDVLRGFLCSSYTTDPATTRTRGDLQPSPGRAGRACTCSNATGAGAGLSCLRLPPSTSGPGRSPFKAVARVRIPPGASKMSWREGTA